MISLPAIPKIVLGDVLVPALDLIPSKMGTNEAKIMLIAIGLQESGFRTRQQIGGPAHGLWQFEQGGGVNGVLHHPASREYASHVCEERGVDPSANAVYAALLTDDILAAAFARLLLWTDPSSLPEIGDENSAWALYQRTWRPGLPYPDRWPANYANARATMIGISP